MCVSVCVCVCVCVFVCVAQAFMRQVKLGPTYFVPNFQIGSFGAITPFTSLIKVSRQGTYAYCIYWCSEQHGTHIHRDKHE